MKMLKIFVVGLIVIVIDLVVKTSSVTVNPLCPTNKIAPHKRGARLGNNGRTFGAFYDLLAPGINHNTPSSLQEEPQADEPDDCGEIEDYDENDLSSITPQSHRRQRQKHNRFIFGWLQQLHSESKPSIFTEPITVPSYRPTRPPTGGYFGNNYYRPQRPQEPTDHVKPVVEAGLIEPHVMYKPGLVGGPIGHIVGLTQVIPKPYHPESTTHIRKHKINYSNGYTSTAASPHTQKPKRSRSYYGDGIVGSFLDLLI